MQNSQSGSDALLVPFLAALQASVAVLLTICAGVLAVQFNLITEGASREVSKLCVKLLLPALLIVNVGSEIQLDAVARYAAIVVWSISYNLLSISLSYFVTWLFNLPVWVTPAISFNNTTSLPLLLIQSLSSTGILDSIDSSSGAIERATSYFLINATIGNSITFTLGPKLLRCHEDNPADDEQKQQQETDEEMDRRIDAEESETEHVNEETSLLPNRVVRDETRMGYAVYKRSEHLRRHLPSWLLGTFHVLCQFVNPPVVGATIGTIIGLVPALHRLFFSSQQEGGYLNAWLTSAIRNCGDLFASLQVIIVGVKLSQAMLRFKKGEASGRVPWAPFVYVIAMRFFLFPAISISIIYALASKTSLLGDDPIMFFAMMMMPTGPPALNLTTLADVTGVDDHERMSIAKFLTIAYAMSPLICLSVVGSLKAVRAIVSE